MANYKDGIIRDGSSPGSGKCLGNVKNGIIREGFSPNLGSGKCLGNVKNGVVRESFSPNLGSGSNVGKVRDFSIKGGDKMDEATAVACYHFLIKKIF